ncbi:hypothetical protein A3A71_00775 [Candidatus Berkelbacteria bacterium RIFCSPLOWO2_01_FULL_50_28]|uniref:Uncharacterized protein n=1 Tax=Candidatus Berkelbacteria bacterium RIFCSPLOWO2_01_FULL_50_28 TaxID=1797471 RepID=A0A1F5EB19_9BACT|nr:MAG: hypothetical protein A2807_01345 [Candidatus Berkelbacteria bacterium RIFCSPHIGHO2_01_FULL_50_36]OGD62884.1 MAG: hypothetical protein A3F39_03945 [Candidatus Berkelbacteria bacterium RIFCSPHIGHO2_12_FULL_50_11]OGD64575.1 MAG: hypothetical protein A3A71_00775 [Candidatus Berkelbacteria bacterium RIFCSPLOWO2_01_FULL_50_28]
MRKAFSFILVALFVLLLAGCAPGPNTAMSTPVPNGEAGFLLGLWHGLIVWVTFIVSLFNDQVSIYEVHNNGGWYNFGYILGLGSALGGTATASSRSNKD